MSGYIDHLEAQAAPTPQPRTRRQDILDRIPALLAQHAGQAPWGENDGRLDSVLQAWQLDPANFMESLLGWGYTIRIEAEAAALDVEVLALAFDNLHLELVYVGPGSLLDPLPDLIATEYERLRRE